MVKKHTELGGKFIEKVINVLMIAKIVSLQHHERCDGEGYMRLSSSEIHPISKLVTVADVADALLSRRPYKASWAVSDVCEYMKAQSGKMFDEEIVRLLLICFEEALSLYHTDCEEE